MDVVKPPRFAPGDKIRVVLYPEMMGVVAGLYGRVGPESEQVYNVRLPRKPKSRYTIVTESQIELAEPAAPATALHVHSESANPGSAD